MINDIWLLQNLIFITVFFFISTFNLLSLWYLAGIYLVLLGYWMFLDDGDIFIGFLWVIDLGVGLVFFIFILHYSVFAQQKATLTKSSREVVFLLLSASFCLIFFFFFYQPYGDRFSSGLTKTWFFFLSWYNYYDVFNALTVTDLNLLKEIYFANNSLEFFIINFVLFYGIIASILTTFLIKRIFSVLTSSQFLSHKMLAKANATYFIRNQDFSKQQLTSAGTRVWEKKKFFKFNDN